MFPQLRQRIGPALDLIVEFSTLGEYRLDADGVVRAAGAPAVPAERAPQLGGAGDPIVAQAAVRRIVAGGAVGQEPAATPAARRAWDVRSLAGSPAAAPASRECLGERRHGAAERRGTAEPGLAGLATTDSTDATSSGADAPRRRRPKPRPRVTAPEQLCLAV